MELSKNQILFGAGALALVAYAMYKPKEMQFHIPNVGWVNKSQMAAYGYQEIPTGSNKFYSQAQINAAAAQAGVPAGSNVDPNSQTFNTILTILGGLQALVPVVQTIVTAANRPQKIQEILNKYTSTISLHYNPNFAYTQNDLQQMTNDQLAYVLDNGALPSVNGLYYAKKK